MLHRRLRCRRPPRVRPPLPAAKRERRSRHCCTTCAAAIPARRYTGTVTLQPRLARASTRQPSTASCDHRASGDCAVSAGGCVKMRRLRMVALAVEEHGVPCSLQVSAIQQHTYQPTISDTARRVPTTRGVRRMNGAPLAVCLAASDSLISSPCCIVRSAP